MVGAGHTDKAQVTDPTTGREYQLRCCSKCRTRPFLYHYTHEGFCQVHYRRRRHDHKPGYRHFCIQETGFSRGRVQLDSFRFLVCSRDGEPDSEYPFPVNQLPLPPLGSTLVKRVRRWIKLMNEAGDQLSLL